MAKHVWKWKIHFSYNSLKCSFKPVGPCHEWKRLLPSSERFGQTTKCIIQTSIITTNFRIFWKIPRKGDTPHFCHFFYTKNGYFLAQNTKYIFFVSKSLAPSIKFLAPFWSFLNLFGAKTPLLSLVGEKILHLKWTRSCMAKQIPPKKGRKIHQ